MNKIVFLSLLHCMVAFATPLQKLQQQKSDASAGCISKYYNKDLGPLEILMMPLGEKLWLRAWLGMHLSNLLHMEGVDLAEVSQAERSKRSLPPDSENDSKSKKNTESVTPNSYFLSIQPLIEENVVVYKLQINVTCLHPSNSITLVANSNLKFDEMTVKHLDFGNISDQVSFKNEQVRHKEEPIEILKVVWSQKESLCDILLQETLIKNNRYQIDIKYSDSISDSSKDVRFLKYHHSSSSETSWFMVINFKYNNLVKLYPGLYGAKQKATFELSVIHPTEMEVVTSSPIQMLEPMSKIPGWVRSHFQVTPPMIPSSLVSIIFNKHDFIQEAILTKGGKMVIGFNQDIDNSLMREKLNYVVLGIDFLEQRLGVPFPAPELKIFFSSNLTLPAEEFWGTILARSDVSPVVLLFFILKQWFGHLITAANESDEKITTSLAYYYAYFCSLDMYEKCEEGGKLNPASNTDFVSVLDVKENMNALDFRNHKMVLFLRMLNFSLSESTFQRGIQVFLKYRSYSTFVEEDLWDALDIQAWADGILDRTLSTKDISEMWLSQDLLPLVTIKNDQENNTLIIDQQVFVRYWPYTVRNQEKILWKIPIPFITENQLKEERPGKIIWLKEKEEIIEDFNNFGNYYIGNYNNIGMYIVSYDDSNWEALSKSLLADGMNQNFVIPAKTRAILMRNAWYLAVAGRLDLTLALNMSLFLKYESDLSVWKAFGEVYFMVAWKLIGTGVEIKFDQFVGDLVIPIYNQTNYSTNTEAREVNVFALYVLCKAGYEPAIMNARVDFHRWLDTHEQINHGIVGGVVRWIAEDWERGLQHVLRLLQERKSQKIRTFLLAQLAGNPSQEKIERLLSFLLTNVNYSFSKVEIMNVLPSISSCKTFLDFLTSEWDIIKKRFASEPNIWQHIMEQAVKKCKTLDGVKLVEEFYKSHQNELGISGNSIKHSLEITRRKMEIIFFQIPKFEEALNDFLNNFKGYI